MKIVLPFPPSSLSGHNVTGNKFVKNKLVKQFRELADRITQDCPDETFPPEGDLRLAIHFYPANHRGDRVNFAGRMKPMIDGIADALGINDKRFLPSYHFYPPGPDARVEVFIQPLDLEEV